MIKAATSSIMCVPLSFSPLILVGATLALVGGYGLSHLSDDGLGLASGGNSRDFGRYVAA
jgi:hypothetical protein